MVLLTCPLYISMSVLRCTLWTGCKCKLSSYAAPRISTRNRWYGLQILDAFHAYGSYIANVTCFHRLLTRDRLEEPVLYRHICSFGCDVSTTFRAAFVKVTNFYEGQDGPDPPLYYMSSSSFTIVRTTTSRPFPLMELAVADLMDTWPIVSLVALAGFRGTNPRPSAP